MIATATVIADSASPQNIRLTTMHLRYPRFIHAELMTHRVFSRNARSSRAVPVEKLLSEEAYIPHFMKNQKGMQSFEEMNYAEQQAAKEAWCDLIAVTRDHVERLMKLGVHKQWANRPLEWFGYIDVLVSSTDWANWFALRDHPQAMPEIQELARAMRKAMDGHIPTHKSPGDWHLPYVDYQEEKELGIMQARKVSVARCARLSYKPFDSALNDSDEERRSNQQKDLELFERLLVARPVHASPAEHQATPDHWNEQHGWDRDGQHGNFTGWRQFRKLLDHEAVQDNHYANF